MIKIPTVHIEKYNDELIEMYEVHQLVLHVCSLKKIDTDENGKLVIMADAATIDTLDCTLFLKAFLYSSDYQFTGAKFVSLDGTVMKEVDIEQE